MRWISMITATGVAWLSYKLWQVDRDGSNKPIYQAPIHDPTALQGQVMIVTGGTAGLGLESAKQLAAAGATVILTARDATKGHVAVEEVKYYVRQIRQQQEQRGELKQTTYESPSVSYKILDLASLESSKSAAQWDDISKIDVLMNNAGTVAAAGSLTADGLDVTFQANHLGPFVLTAVLSPKFAPQAKIINLSSGAHTKFSGRAMQWDSIWNNSASAVNRMNGIRMYGQSKLANIYFTTEFQRRIDAAGLQWTTVAVHPGRVVTSIWNKAVPRWEQIRTGDRTGVSTVRFSIEQILYRLVRVLFLDKSVEQGAATQVWLATGAADSDHVRGQYCVDCQVVALEPFALDEREAARLWKESEERAGIKFQIPPPDSPESYSELHGRSGSTTIVDGSLETATTVASGESA